MDIENKLKKYYTLDEKIILGCSGGPDSMYLLYQILDTPYKDNLVVCYFNHKTRPETDIEEDFLRELCEKYNIIFETASTDFEKIMKLYPSRSFEELAREKRYQFFNAIMSMYGANKVMLGHHLDDRIETFIFNMLRGTKLTGLINMQELHGGVLRPLLYVQKKDILKFLQDNNLPYKIDQTNIENTYTRNKIRNTLIPEIEKIHPESKKNLANLMEYFKDMQEYLDNEIIDFLGDQRTFSLQDFLQKPIFFQNEVIRYIYYVANNKSTIGLSEGNIAEIIKFLNGKNNKTRKEIKQLKMFKDGDIINW